MFWGRLLGRQKQLGSKDHAEYDRTLISLADKSNKDEDPSDGGPTLLTLVTNRNHSPGGGISLGPMRGNISRSTPLHPSPR